MDQGRKIPRGQGPLLDGHHGQDRRVGQGEGGGEGVERPYLNCRNLSRRSFENLELGMQPKEKPTSRVDEVSGRLLIFPSKKLLNYICTLLLVCIHP